MIDIYFTIILIALLFISAILLIANELHYKFLVPGKIHKEQMEKYYKAYDKISYSYFIDMVKNIEWVLWSDFSGSIFERNYFYYNKTQFHASCIVINNQGYLLSPLDYLKAEKYKDSLIKKLERLNEDKS